MFLNHDELRARLDPLIRKEGVGAIAELAEVAQPHLSAWLNGTRPLSDNAISRVGAVLGIDVRAGYEVKRKRISA